jgi:hypothetical protein
MVHITVPCSVQNIPTHRTVLYRVLVTGDYRLYLSLPMMIIIIRLSGHESSNSSTYCYCMDKKCADCTCPHTIYSPKHSPHHNSSENKKSECAYGNMFINPRARQQRASKCPHIQWLNAKMLGGHCMLTDGSYVGRGVLARKVTYMVLHRQVGGEFVKIYVARGA